MVTRIHTQNLLDEGGTRYLVEQLVQRLVTGNIDLTDYVKKDELQEIIDGLDIDIDLSDYATEQYVREQIAQALVGDDIDLSDYVTKKELENALKDVNLEGYATEEWVLNKIAESVTGESCSCDLTGYATKEYVDEHMANIDSGLRKFVTIEGTRVYCKNDMPMIPTYDGSTTLSFPNPVIMRVYTTNDDVFNIDNYVEYTGDTIVIPNTTNGFLKDYIIYNICQQSDSTTEDYNILKKYVTGICSGTAGDGKYVLRDQKEGFSLVETNGKVVSFKNSFDISLLLDWKKMYFGIMTDVSEWSGYHGDDNYIGNIEASDVFRVDKRLWYENIDELKSYMESDNHALNTMANNFKSLIEAYESNNVSELPTPPELCLNTHISAEDTMIIGGTEVGGRLSIVLTPGQTYTIESITGKPFVVKGWGWEYQILKMDAGEVNYSVVGTKIVSPVTAFTQNGRSLRWDKVNKCWTIDSWVDGHETVPIHYGYESVDGSAITFTVPDVAAFGSADRIPVVSILCESEDYYDSLRLTRGELSYSELTNSNYIVNVTANNESQKSEIIFDLYDYTKPDEYIRYSSDSIYEIYDLDDYVTQSEVETLLETKLGVIENGSY